jgi:tagatose-1,6-bisphosphate aldolase
VNAFETPLEMAQRHVTEGEALVARQTALLAAFEAKGFDTTAAADLLACLKDTLRLMYEDLVHQQARATQQHLTSAGSRRAPVTK